MTTGPLRKEEIEPLRMVQQVYLRYHSLICEICDTRQEAIFASEDSKDGVVTNQDRVRLDTLVDIAHGLQLIYDAMQLLEMDHSQMRGDMTNCASVGDDEKTVH